MTQNKDLPAFANPGSEYGPGSGGLTKREYFAVLAMQGILSNDSLRTDLLSDMKHDGTNMDNYIAVYALKQADELLKQFE